MLPITAGAMYTLLEAVDTSAPEWWVGITLRWLVRYTPEVPTSGMMVGNPGGKLPSPLLTSPEWCQLHCYTIEIGVNETLCEMGSVTRRTIIYPITPPEWSLSSCYTSEISTSEMLSIPPGQGTPHRPHCSTLESCQLPKKHITAQRIMTIF